MIDHVLMIGFGGPTKPEELRPFLAEVQRGGVPIPPERLEAVIHHYDAVGGCSPYNEHTIRQFQALRTVLAERHIKLPIFLGMRNWHPFLHETMTEIKARGLRQGLGIILAPHRSDASHEKYVRAVEEAKARATAAVAYAYLPSWHDHPLFIEAQAAQTERALASLPAAARANAVLVFTAHALPVAMAQRSPYAQEVARSSTLVAERLERTRWSLAYQSRSGNPKVPWLEPDVETVLKQLRAQGESHAILVPIGFLSDNVEVLYDLDIEAKQAAAALGLKLVRASTVMDHPKFIALLADLIGEALHPEAARRAQPAARQI